MPKLIAKFATLRGFVTLVRDPSRINQVFSMASAIMDDEMLTRWIARVTAESETARAALKKRHRLGAITRAELATYPAGSLGQAYLAHLDGNRIDPETLPRLESSDERSYMLAHVYECHDLWHTVTGFGTSVAEELGLQAFHTAQGPTKGPWALLTAGFLNALIYDIDDKDNRIDAISRGWRMGRKAKLFFGVDWRELLGEDLGVIRRRFGIELEPQVTRAA